MELRKPQKCEPLVTVALPVGSFIDGLREAHVDHGAFDEQNCSECVELTKALDVHPADVRLARNATDDIRQLATV